ncbi:DUF3306 domain-containing protein [Jhaorihella thermophila]|uniref:DUF3306 domain-containing protein n=1 Tax=Jhaorihella thermophila TaxID=488547 RepID=A0A1H5WMM3_9RHOB|nr:DUF3306 domain-containing protein [Jhaorihella thermophila]SEG00591.1 Protein of unknown function [Jhaorihella thermophila]
MREARDFWSRRKAAVQAEAEAERLDAALREEEAARAALEEKSDEEILEELNLPDPDSLQPGDDVTGFMARAVPERLRRRALRRLWGLNPTLANVDGLVDYGEDFTDAATVIEGLATAYAVGKGMIAKVVNEAPETGEKDTPRTARAEQTDADPPKVTTTKVAVAPEAAPEETEEETETVDTAPVPRRMRFTFEG